MSGPADATREDVTEELIRAYEHYRWAAIAHPGLLPILSKRESVRFGLEEGEATVTRLLKHGFPEPAVLPILNALEVLALGSAEWESAREGRRLISTPSTYPMLRKLSRATLLTFDEQFRICARAIIESLCDEAESKPECSDRST
jgi:hypothetical protein